MNLPNKITIGRILIIPLFMVALLSGLFSPQASRYVAVGLFILASASDFLDGYLARKLELVTTFGKFMDPIADKLLVSAALVSMVGLGDIPAWMVIIIISREFLVSGFRLVAAEKGVVIAASMWAKVKTLIQMIMIIVVLLNLNNDIVNAVGELLKWLAVILTVVSAYDYIYKNRDVMKTRNEGEKKA